MSEFQPFYIFVETQEEAEPIEALARDKKTLARLWLELVEKMDGGADGIRNPKAYQP